MKKFILFLLILCPVFGFGQSYHSGIILPIIDSLENAEKYCCVLSPIKGFTVYDNPNGKIIGMLKRLGDPQKDDQAHYKIYLLSKNKKIQVDQFREIQNDLFAINYTDSVDGFIKVLDTLKSHWLSVAELNRKGFKPVSWYNFMLSVSQQELGFYANEPGLRLRKEPNANSEVIGSVRGDLFEIKLTGESSGQWNKVKVIKYKQNPCDSETSTEENIEYKTEGWLKIIDNRGEPNLWRYTRGC